MDSLFGANILGHLELLKSQQHQQQRNGGGGGLQQQQLPSFHHLLPAAASHPLFGGGDQQKGTADLMSQLQQLVSPLASAANGDFLHNNNGEAKNSNGGQQLQHQAQQKQMLYNKIFSREKKKFSQEISDFLVIEVLKRKELLVENNTSRDLTFSENKRNAWTNVRTLLMAQHPGFELGIEAIKSHWRYRKRKVTDAFAEIKGNEAELKMRTKLSAVDWEIFTQLKESNMLLDGNGRARSGGDEDMISNEMTPSEASDEALGMGGGGASSNSPFSSSATDFSARAGAFPSNVSVAPFANGTAIGTGTTATNATADCTAANSTQLLLQQLTASLLLEKQHQQNLVGVGEEQHCWPNGIGHPGNNDQNNNIAGGGVAGGGNGSSHQQKQTAQNGNAKSAGGGGGNVNHIGNGRAEPRKCQQNSNLGENSGGPLQQRGMKRIKQEEPDEDDDFGMEEGNEEDDDDNSLKALKRQALQAQKSAFDELRLAASTFRTVLMPELLTALQNYNRNSNNTRDFHHNKQQQNSTDVSDK